jgi:hypothetical protein
VTAAGAGFYMAVTTVALIVAVYLALHVIGFVFELLLLAAAAAIALSAWRAWRVGD